MNWHRNSVFIALISLLCFSSCIQDKFEVNLKPGSESCLESMLFVSNPNATDLPFLQSQRPVSIDLLQEEAAKPENLRKGIKNKKYVLHFYRRVGDFDIAIPPVKFPLFWKIDSTLNQTEGTFLIDIKSESDVFIEYKCDGCATISPKGEKITANGVASAFEFSTSMHVSPQETIQTDHFAVRLAPRQIPFSKAVGESYVITISSPETYCNAAKDRLQFFKTENSPTGFSMRFRDNSEYWASSFLKEIGIALAMSDHENAEQLIQTRVDSISVKVDSLKSIVGNIENLLDALPKRAEKMDEFNETEKELVLLLEQRAALQIKKAGMLPRILILATGTPCN